MLLRSTQQEGLWGKSSTDLLCDHFFIHYNILRTSLLSGKSRAVHYRIRRTTYSTTNKNRIGPRAVQRRLRRRSVTDLLVTPKTR